MSVGRCKCRRVVLKLGGEALVGQGHYGIDAGMLDLIAAEIAEVKRLGCDLAVVMGGGNICRGLAASVKGMNRATGDYMGMLATLINSLALQDALERTGVPTRVMSALSIERVAEPYIRRRATRHLEKGRVVLFAAGTGNPYFTTDTAAALRGMEIGADIILKATKVDGVYDADPMLVPQANRYERLSYLQVLSKDLKVMDGTAISLCREGGLPVL